MQTNDQKGSAKRDRTLRVLAGCFGGLLVASALVGCDSDESSSQDGGAGARGGEGGTPSSGGAGGGANGGSGSGAGGGGSSSGGSGGASSGGSGGANSGGSGGASSGGSGGANSGGSGGASSGGSGGANSGGSGGAGGAPPNCSPGEGQAGETDWPHALEVTDGAVYCGLFDEGRTLKEELAAKAMLSIAPGCYPLPGEAHSDFGLPLSVRWSDDAADTVSAGAGELTYQTNAFFENIEHQYALLQPVSKNPPGGWIHMQLFDTVPEGVEPELRLDGSESDLDAQLPSYRYFGWCDSKDCASYRGFFDSCTFPNSSLHHHEVALELGGEAVASVVFDVRIGTSFASTEPGAFVRASGTYQDESFDQESYWKLVYNPQHHHFARDFAVLFDAPIGGACGIEVANLEPGSEDYLFDEAYAVDCELNRIETLEVQSHVHTLEE